MQDPIDVLKARRWQELRRADRSRPVEDITAQVEREFKLVSPAPAAAPAESTGVTRPPARTPSATPAPAATPKTQPTVRASGSTPMPGFTPESTRMTGAPAPNPSKLSGGAITAGALRSLLQGLTFNYWDEWEAAVNSLSPNITYREMRDAIRKDERDFRRDFPGTAATLEVGGAVVPALAALAMGNPAPASSVAARATPLLGRVIQGGAAGAGYGALQGAGTAAELKDVPGAMGVGAGVGGLLGGAIPVVGQAGRFVLGGAGNMLESAVRSTATGTGVPARMAQQLMPLAERRAESRARQSILQRLQEDGLTPQQAAERLAAMTERGTPAAVADVGGRNMLELANRPNLLGGRGREVMGELGESRVAGSAERLATATEKNAGTLRGNVNQMVRDIADRRRAPATQLYNEAFAHGEVKLNPRQYQIMTSDVATDAQRAWKQGQRLSVLFAGEPNLPPLAPLFEVVDDVYAGKAISLLRQPTVRDLNYIKLGLDDAIAAAERAGDNTAMAALTKAKNDLIDPVKAQVPKYAEALDFWGGEQGLMNALNAGKRFLRGSADDFDDVVNGLSPDELEMFRTGAVNAIREQLERRDGTVNAARFMSDPTVLERLKRVFPDEESFQRLRDIVTDEQKLAALDKRLRNQSATARNLGEMADEMFSSTYTPGTNPVTGLAFSTFGSVRDAATRQARSASTDALARLLSLQGTPGANFLSGLDDISRDVMRRNAARSGAGQRTAGLVGGAFNRGPQSAQAMGLAGGTSVFSPAGETPSDVGAAPAYSLDKYLQETADLITSEEGWRSRAYEDTGGVPTIGFGRTGRDVRPGMSTTLAAEQEWLKRRLRDDAEYLESQGITPFPEFISAQYNLGREGFRRTGAGEAFKAGDYGAAGDSLIANGKMAFNRKTGRMEPLLLGRRRREREGLLLRQPTRREPTLSDILNR